MNITKQVSNIFMPFLLPAAMLMSSCGAENLEEKGTPLPDGEYPLQLTASVDGMTSRTAGKDAWTDGDIIGVRIGDSEPGKYKLDADGGVKEFVTPLYWQNTAPATVTAWYPYDSQNNVDISDQTAGFADFDFLYASADNQSYSSPTVLKFKHRMAKVKYTLVKGDGITDEELAEVKVQLAGCIQASFSEGALSGAGDGWITPTSDNEALLVPKDMTGKKFINVEVNGTDFYYTPEEQDAGLLAAGMVNTYTITVNAKSIDVKAVTGGEWTDSGNSKDLVREDFYVAYQPTDVKPGDYFYSDGTWSDGGLRKINLDGNYEFEDIGPLSGKTCMGIVFYIRNADSPTDVCYYETFEGDPTGYIVSIDQNESKWSEEVLNGGDFRSEVGINGYSSTMKYAQKFSDKGLVAIPWCTEQHTAISESDNAVFSAWYMPSQEEYKLMRGVSINNSNPILEILQHNLGKFIDAQFENDFYFSCELMGYGGNYLHMYNLITGSEDAGDFKNGYDATFPYKAVCAFKLKN